MIWRWPRPTARQWLWAALHCLAVYLIVASLVFFLASGYVVCVFDLAAFCGQTNPSALPLIIAATFLAPVVLLVYALRAGARRHPRGLLDGLTVSRLTAEER